MSKIRDAFIKEYLKNTGIDLNVETEQREFIFNILNRIKDLNNSIVDYYIYKDNTLVNFFNNNLKIWLNQDTTFVKDIIYINAYNKSKIVSASIDENNIDLAYSQIKELIEQFNKYYERMS